MKPLLREGKYLFILTAFLLSDFIIYGLHFYLINQGPIIVRIYSYEVSPINCLTCLGNVLAALLNLALDILTPPPPKKNTCKEKKRKERTEEGRG